MLLWTWGYKYLFKPLFSVLLDTCPDVELLDPMVAVCLFPEEQPCCFPQRLYPFHSHQQYTLLQLLYTLVSTCYFLAFKFGHPNAWKQHDLLWSHLSLTAPLSKVLVFRFEVERKPVSWQRRVLPLLLIPFPSFFFTLHQSSGSSCFPEDWPSFLPALHQLLSWPPIWPFTQCHPVCYFEAHALLIQLAWTPWGQQLFSSPLFRSAARGLSQAVTL